jgi:hypothetical protein
LLLSDGLTVVSGAVILPGVSDDVLQAIIVIFQHRNQVARLLLHHAEIELAASASAAEVFQEASPAGRLLQVYAKRYARVYLREALGAEIKRYGTRHIGPPLSLSHVQCTCAYRLLCVHSYLQQPVSFEVDATRVKSNQELVTNKHNLLATCKAILDAIITMSALQPKYVLCAQSTLLVCLSLFANALARNQCLLQAVLQCVHSRVRAIPQTSPSCSGPPRVPARLLSCNHLSAGLWHCRWYGMRLVAAGYLYHTLISLCVVCCVLLIDSATNARSHAQPQGGISHSVLLGNGRSLP